LEVEFNNGSTRQQIGNSATYFVSLLSRIKIKIQRVGHRC